MNYLYLLSSGAIFFILREILAGCGIYHRQRNVPDTDNKPQTPFCFQTPFHLPKGKRRPPRAYPSSLCFVCLMQTNKMTSTEGWNVRLLVLVPDLSEWHTCWLSWASPGHSRLVARPQPPQCTQPPGLQLQGWHVGTRQWKEKKNQGLNKFPPALRKEDNCIMMDHSWCLFFVSPKGKETAPLGAPVRTGAKHCQLLVPSPGSPWEAVSWHTTYCSWAVSPLATASLVALVQWLLQLPQKLQQSPKLSGSGMEIVCVLESSCPYWAFCCLSSSDPNYPCVFDVWRGESGS